MKALVPIIIAFLENRTSRRNLLTLGKLLVVLLVLVVGFSLLFHVLMENEGQHHSWLTGFYWTLTVMSTLGFGDITFTTDSGRLFSLVVLVTGVMFLLVLLPFTFIEFFYAPWMKAQAAASAPRELPVGTRRHVIMTVDGPINRILVRLLEKHHYPYFLLVPSVAEALPLNEKDLPVVVGELSDPATFRRLRIEHAALVVATRTDVINTNVTFSIREINDRVPIIASAQSRAAHDALELAGVTQILSLEEMMGQALARRVAGTDAHAQIIGTMDELVIAEAATSGTALAGHTIAESNLRPTSGLTVVGIWDHGRLVPVEPTTTLQETSVLVLAGTREQVDRYNEHFGQGPDHPGDPSPPAKSHVVIVGGGRVGRATARALNERGVDWTMIERDASRVEFPDHTLVGEASDFDLLVKAGLREAASIVVTTHDDDTNTFLTIFYRKLRPRTQIISRCTHEATVARLHRAGADLVLSYASMSAFTIFNALKGGGDLLLAEGVSVFTVPVPPSLGGKSLAETQIPTRTGCSVLAIIRGETRDLSLKPDTVLPDGGKLVLVGSLDAEEQFLTTFVND